MKRWRAPFATQLTLYLFGALALLVVAGGIGQQIAPFVTGPLDAWPFSLRFFSLVLLASGATLGALACIMAAARSMQMGYNLDRNAITVVQPHSHYIIPLDQIVNVSQESSASAAKPTQVFGRGSAAQILVVETHTQRYRLAVRDRDRFAQELDQRRRLGAVQPQREGMQPTREPWSAFLHGRVPQVLFLLTGIVNVGLWYLLMWRYPTLPDTIPVRFDPVGGTAGTRTRSYTLLLPAVATLAGFGNILLAMLVYRRSRLSSELLIFGALMVQLVFFAAIWFVVTVTR